MIICRRDDTQVSILLRSLSRLLAAVAVEYIAELAWSAPALGFAVLVGADVQGDGHPGGAQDQLGVVGQEAHVLQEVAVVWIDLGARTLCPGPEVSVMLLVLLVASCWAWVRDDLAEVVEEGM